MYGLATSKLIEKTFMNLKYFHYAIYYNEFAFYTVSLFIAMVRKMCQPVGVFVDVNQCSGTSISSSYSNPQRHTRATESILVVMMMMRQSLYVVLAGLELRDHSSPASASSQVLGVMVCTTTPS